MNRQSNEIAFQVANIRFNVARELVRVSPHCGLPAYQSQIVPVLTVLMEDEDRDVRFYAGTTAAALEELLAGETPEF